MPDDSGPVLVFSRHAVTQMFARAIDADEVATVVSTGETIASYPDERPHPKRLILGHTVGGPLHVVVGEDGEAGRSVVITTYRPDPALWESDWRTRRKP